MNQSPVDSPRRRAAAAAASADLPAGRPGAGVRLTGVLLFAAAVASARAGWALAGLGGAAAAVLWWQPPPRWRAFGVRWARLEFFVLFTAGLALASPDGPAAFVRLLVRGSLGLAAVTWLAETTPFHELVAVLRRAGCPALLLSTVTLLERYRAVLAAESGRLRRARAARTFRAGRPFAWRNLAEVAAQLFVRSLARGERVYAAMRARGWR